MNWRAGSDGELSVRSKSCKFPIHRPLFSLNMRGIQWAIIVRGQAPASRGQGVQQGGDSLTTTGTEATLIC